MRPVSVSLLVLTLASESSTLIGVLGGLSAMITTDLLYSCLHTSIESLKLTNSEFSLRTISSVSSSSGSIAKVDSG